MKKQQLRETYHARLALDEMEFFKFTTVSFHVMATHTHFHEAIECIYVNSGSLLITVDGVKSRAYPGDLIVFHSGAIHDIYSEEFEDNDYYVLKLMPRVLSALSPQDKSKNFAMRFISGDPNLKYIWRKEEIKGTDIEIGLKRLIASLDRKKKVSLLSKKISALMVFEGLYSSDPVNVIDKFGTDDAFFYSTFYINEHYAEPITAEEIAEQVNMSISSFSRKFKSATGKSFKDYLNTVRTNRAEELLKNTGLSISSIAAECGFNNSSYFIAIYKRYKGKTPLDERK